MGKYNLRLKKFRRKKDSQPEDEQPKKAEPLVDDEEGSAW